LKSISDIQFNNLSDIAERYHNKPIDIDFFNIICDTIVPLVENHLVNKIILNALTLEDISQLYSVNYIVRPLIEEYYVDKLIQDYQIDLNKIPLDDHKINIKQYSSNQQEYKRYVIPRINPFYFYSHCVVEFQTTALLNFVIRNGNLNLLIHLMFRPTNNDYQPKYVIPDEDSANIAVKRKHYHILYFLSGMYLPPSHQVYISYPIILNMNSQRVEGNNDDNIIKEISIKDDKFFINDEFVSDIILPTFIGADFAASNNDIDMLEYLYHYLIYPTGEGCDSCCKKGQLSCIQWIYNKVKILPTTRGANKAAANGHLDVIIWLEQFLLEPIPNIGLNNAAINRHYDVLDYMANKGSIPDNMAWNSVLSNRDVDMILWLLDHNVVYYDDRISNFYSRISNEYYNFYKDYYDRKINIEDYIDEQGNPINPYEWNKDAQIVLSISRKHIIDNLTFAFKFHLIDILINQNRLGRIFTTNDANIALEYEQLDILQWLDEVTNVNNVNFNSNIYSTTPNNIEFYTRNGKVQPNNEGLDIAILNGKMNSILYMRDLGINPSTNMLSPVVEKGYTNIFLYLLQFATGFSKSSSSHNIPSLLHNTPSIEDISILQESNLANIAAARNRLDILQILEKYGVYANIEGANNAARNRHLDMLKYLKYSSTMRSERQASITEESSSQYHQDDKFRIIIPNVRGANLVASESDKDIYSDIQRKKKIFTNKLEIEEVKYNTLDILRWLAEECNVYPSNNELSYNINFIGILQQNDFELLLWLASIPRREAVSSNGEKITMTSWSTKVKLLSEPIFPTSLDIKTYIERNSSSTEIYRMLCFLMILTLKNPIDIIKRNNLFSPSSDEDSPPDSTSFNIQSIKNILYHQEIEFVAEFTPNIIFDVEIIRHLANYGMTSMLNFIYTLSDVRTSPYKHVITRIIGSKLTVSYVLHEALFHKDLIADLCHDLVTHSNNIFNNSYNKSIYFNIKDVLEWYFTIDKFFITIVNESFEIKEGNIGEDNNEDNIEENNNEDNTGEGNNVNIDPKLSLWTTLQFNRDAVNSLVKTNEVDLMRRIFRMNAIKDANFYSYLREMDGDEMHDDPGYVDVEIQLRKIKGMNINHLEMLQFFLSYSRETGISIANLYTLMLELAEKGRLQMVKYIITTETRLQLPYILLEVLDKFISILNIEGIEWILYFFSRNNYSIPFDSYIAIIKKYVRSLDINVVRVFYTYNINIITDSILDDVIQNCNFDILLWVITPSYVVNSISSNSNNINNDDNNNNSKMRSVIDINSYTKNVKQDVINKMVHNFITVNMLKLLSTINLYLDSTGLDNLAGLGYVSILKYMYNTHPDKFRLVSGATLAAKNGKINVLIWLDSIYQTINNKNKDEDINDQLDNYEIQRFKATVTNTLYDDEFEFGTLLPKIDILDDIIYDGRNVEVITWLINRGYKLNITKIDKKKLYTYYNLDIMKLLYSKGFEFQQDDMDIIAVQNDIRSDSVLEYVYDVTGLLPSINIVKTLPQGSTLTWLVKLSNDGKLDDDIILILYRGKNYKFIVNGRVKQIEEERRKQVETYYYDDSDDGYDRYSDSSEEQPEQWIMPNVHHLSDIESEDQSEDESY